MEMMQAIIAQLVVGMQALPRGQTHAPRGNTADDRQEVEERLGRRPGKETMSEEQASNLVDEEQEQDEEKRHPRSRRLRFEIKKTTDSR